MLSKVLSF